MRDFLLSVIAYGFIASGAWAQSTCTSDRQPKPARIVEHFISADCEACWRSPQTGKADPRSMALDWIVPSSHGDDAPLSAATTRDALQRLDSLGLAAPVALKTTMTRVLPGRANQLRLAHGPAIGAYIGAIIELKTAFKVMPQESLAAWLLLVEVIPAGTDGTQVDRNLVRNVLVTTWRAPDQKPEGGNFIFRELRPLNIPQGARTDRLRLVGWVQDTQGRVLSATQSVCPVPIGTD